jgi:lipopolysaccharide export system permease protein
MKYSSTLNHYLARFYTKNMLFISFVLLGIVYLFDTVELLRRASDKDIPLGLVLQMGLLKLPEVGGVIFPFAILYSAMFTFWQLNRRHELTVVRSAGFSVWQFISPVVGVAVVVAFLNVTVINPLGAVFVGKYERLENQYLARKHSYVTLLKEGLWLRQFQDKGHVILHAGKISLPQWELKNVMVLYFDDQDNFIQRLDAESARLENGAWQMQKVTRNTPRGKGEKMASFSLPTDLTTTQIEESFASPDTMSFWTLPGFIRTLESTGFDATRLRIHFQGLLSQPVLFAAMILIAACVSLRPPRQGGVLAFMIAGVLLGFVVFFMSSFLSALGASHQIPAILAAWAPALIAFLLGVTVMLSLEDG